MKIILEIAVTWFVLSIVTGVVFGKFVKAGRRGR